MAIPGVQIWNKIWLILRSLVVDFEATRGVLSRPYVKANFGGHEGHPCKGRKGVFFFFLKLQNTVHDMVTWGRNERVLETQTHCSPYCYRGHNERILKATTNVHHVMNGFLKRNIPFIIWPHRSSGWPHWGSGCIFMGYTNGAQVGFLQFIWAECFILL